MTSMILEYYKHQKYLEDVKKQNEENAKRREEKTERQLKEALNIINKYK